MTHNHTKSRRLADLEAENRELRAALERWRTHAKQLDRLADQDPLTGVLNRRAVVRELARTLAFTRRHKGLSSLLYIDVDNLKRINDGYAHDAGDAVLRHVVNILNANIRASDLVGRVGGDEFVVLLHQASGAEAGQKAEDLRHQIQTNPLPYNGVNLTVSLSVGYTTFDGSETAEAAVDAADRSMYANRQKRRGNG